MKEENNIELFGDFSRVYFIGIGGIGMSAIARYFHSLGYNVAGYDRKETDLTKKMQNEGIAIHYKDLDASIPAEFRNPQKTLVVYTPAIPKNHGELLFFQHHAFTILKRSEVLGKITQNSKGLCVAGTHGKTTTSSLLAHVLHNTGFGCNAFLGGVSSNFKSNFVANTKSDYTVVEADEFDRSFMQLHPFASIITSIDPDHLDIYSNKKTFAQSFEDFAALTDENGILVVQSNIQLSTKKKQITYSTTDENADYLAQNIRYENAKMSFDVQTPNALLTNLKLGIPGVHNVENATACIALLENLGVSTDEIQAGLQSFTGVKRRFDVHVNSQKLIYIDDYAHHPTEIAALISSVRKMFPKQKITAIFQPHLFSRTKDFMEEFATELAKVDALYLLPIYPAREEPILGVNSEILLKKISLKEKFLYTSEQVVQKMQTKKEGVFITMGAGDIDQLVEPLKNNWNA